MTSSRRNVLLIISGGIAAYKSLELIRRLGDEGVRITPVMTQAASEFVTPLSVASLAGTWVRKELFQLTEEGEIGHIRLSRDCEAVIVAPTTANLMAKMAHGIADDLASTLLLANNRPLFLAPAMNPVMWQHPATRQNVAILKERGVHFIGPDIGDMACHEEGAGRMSEIPTIIAELKRVMGWQGAETTPSFPRSLSQTMRPLDGQTALVTAGPTHEPIDPVRFIANRSSGKQGYAIAEALAEAGANVTLVSGPTSLPPPAGVKFVPIERAEEMYQASLNCLPCDIAIMAAAVGDWRPAHIASQKLKKQGGQTPPSLELVENPDILRAVAGAATRPRLVIGFAAESEDGRRHAIAKYRAKGCDWLLLNDIGAHPEIFGGDQNQVTLFRSAKDGEQGETWPWQDKMALARQLVATIAQEGLGYKGVG